MTKRIRKGSPVGPRTRELLAADVAVLGDAEVARSVGICVNTLARVLANLEVYGGTEAACRAYADRRRAAA
jgi:hypothetical protein